MSEKTEKIEKTQQHCEMQSPSLYGLFSSFAGNTTAHGFSQITLSTHFSLRILWIVVLVGCQIGLYTQIYPLIQKYNEKPIKTRVYLREESTHIFPVIALCNVNMIPEYKLSKLIGFVGDDIREEMHRKNVTPIISGTPTMPKVSKPRKSEMTKEDEIFNEEPDQREAYDQRNEYLAQMGDVAINLEMKTTEFGYDFDAMIERCTWKRLYDCKDAMFWTTVWHWRYGNCFAFNLKDNNGSFAKVTGAGPDFGLTVDINIQQSSYLSDILTDTAGAILYVGNQEEVIDPYTKGHSLSPGHVHYIGLTKKIITRVDPFNNNSCRSHRKRDLGSRSFSQRFVSKYSTKLCRDFCLAIKQISACGCSDYWLPSLHSNRTCNPDIDFECSNPLHVQAINGELDCLSNCTLPCDETKFTYSSSSRVYPKKSVYAEDDQNLLSITIYFQNMETIVFEDEAYYKLENLLGDIGGQLGLWSGISAFTVIELLIFLFQLLLLPTRYLEKRRATIASNKVQEVSCTIDNKENNNATLTCVSD